MRTSAFVPRMHQLGWGVVLKRLSAIFLLAALVQQVHAQQPVAPPAGMQSKYRLLKVPPGLDSQAVELGLTYHTVEKGETLESILLARKLAPTPRAVGFVLDANPALASADQIYAGSQIFVPEVLGAPSDAPWFKLGAPSPVLRLTNVANDLAQRGDELENEEERQSFKSLAETLRQASSPDAGLSASSIETLRGNAQAILMLSKSVDVTNTAKAAVLAKDSDSAVAQVVSNGRSRNSNKIAIQVAATSPPAGVIPQTCRIRYAYLAHTIKGHVVPRLQTTDFENSRCDQGKQIFEVGGFYGVWAEWVEGGVTRRSQIKDFRILEGFGPTVDLPLSPFE